MARYWANYDEWYPVITITPAGNIDTEGPFVRELDAAFIARYNRIMAEFYELQRELGAEREYANFAPVRAP